MDDGSQVQWLTDDEQASWLALAGMLSQLPPAIDAQLQRDSALTHFEYQVLSGLSMAPERRLRMSVLAVLAGGSLPRLSQVVARLEKRGLVERETDPQDRRATLAVLTDQGMASVENAAPGHVAEVRRLVFDNLTKVQQKQLQKIGMRILLALHPEDPGLTSLPFHVTETAREPKRNHLKD